MQFGVVLTQGHGCSRLLSRGHHLTSHGRWDAYHHCLASLAVPLKIFCNILMSTVDLKTETATKSSMDTRHIQTQHYK